MQLIVRICIIASLGLLVACSADKVPPPKDVKLQATKPVLEVKSLPADANEKRDDAQKEADISKERKQKPKPLSEQQRLQNKRMRASLAYDKKVLEQSQTKSSNPAYAALLQKVLHIEEQISLASDMHDLDERNTHLEGLRTQYLELRHEIDVLEHY